jgi:hypothetical protein
MNFQTYHTIANLALVLTGFIAIILAIKDKDYR